jgi:hypothetical protein
MTSHAGDRPDKGVKRQLTYDVRIWKMRVVKGAKGTSYQVRWNVAGKICYETFKTKGLAESHESKLRTAAREGEAFDAGSGLPLSMLKDEPEPTEEEQPVSWYEFACSYVDMKWQEVAPNSRRDGRSPQARGRLQPPRLRRRQETSPGPARRRRRPKDRWASTSRPSSAANTTLACAPARPSY